MVGLMPQMLTPPPEKEHPLPTETEAGWAPEPGWTFWRREISCPSYDLNPGLSTPLPSSHTDHTITAPDI